MKRAYDKPLGYAGDYEMMNMLYRDHAEGESIFGRVVNMHAAQEPAAAANINRLTLLANKICEIANESSERIRIASVGCGPAREIWKVLDEFPAVGARLDVALIDQEPRAIELGERTLAPFAAGIGARVVFLRESVRRLLTTKTLSDALGERDFVYSAGLFDYLNERSFTALLQALYQSVVPGGTVSIGNVSVDNPTRWWMEYSCEWHLLHRSKDELRALGARVSPAPTEIVVESEPLGVNLFLTLRK
jgi:extracellular factor (EF) 3-hydroxypalmitic acid methyl ester biosynthesis protein